MADTAPLVFETHLGMLRPANAAAETAMHAIKGRVRVEIKGGVANQRRRGLYWSVAALVVPLLNDAHGLTLDEQDLHDITREKLRIGETINLPSGDTYFKPRSTSNRAMNEADRAERLLAEQAADETQEAIGRARGFDDGRSGVDDLGHQRLCRTGREVWRPQRPTETLSHPHPPNHQQTL